MCALTVAKGAPVHNLDQSRLYPTSANSEIYPTRATLSPELSDEDPNSQLENQAPRECKRRCCKRPADQDSEFCLKHEQDQRRYNREYDRRRRAEWDKNKRCMRCGASKRHPDSKWCAPCLIRLDRMRRGMRADHKLQLENADRWRADPNRDGDLSWNRYRGKGRPGRLTREDQAKEDKRQILWAIAKLEEAYKGIDDCLAPAIADLPKFQRDAERRQRVSDPIEFAGRLSDEVADKYKGSR
jgi:hypothetical protein